MMCYHVLSLHVCCLPGVLNKVFKNMFSVCMIYNLTSNDNVSSCSEEIQVFSGLAGKEGGSAFLVSYKEQN